MGSPAMFATIGDALPAERRAMGFTIQSMLKRVPMVISPLIGGAMTGALGLQQGIRHFCPAGRASSICRSRCGTAQSQDTHESFLQFQQLSLTLMLFFGPVIQGFFQEDQVSAEFELCENQAAERFEGFFLFGG